MLTNLFITLGWSRDDLKWLILQIVAVAGLITSNAFDVPYWCAYLGIPLSPTALHWVFGTAAVVLWLAGKYDSSSLPSGPAMKSGTVPTSPASLTKMGAAVLLACVLVGSMMACAGNLTPVAAAASAATKVEQTGSLILKAAQTANAQINPLTGSPVISRAQLDAVAIACDTLGRLGTRLAQGLTDYQAAKAAGGSTAALSAAIQALVADATGALSDIGKAIPPGIVATVDQAVTQALGLYAQIKAGVL